VTELARDHIERDALACQFDGVGVTELVGREAAPDARFGGESAEFDARVGARPGPSAGRAVDDAEQRADRGGRCERPARGAVAPSPRRPCRSRGADRPCRCGRAATRAWGRGRVRRARAPPRRAGRRARGPRSRGGAGRRAGRCWPRASRRRSLLRSAGRRDRAAPCCGADVRRDSGAWSRASGADRRHRVRARRSRDLLPFAQRDTEPADLPALTHPRQRHHLQIALWFRPAGAEAGGLSARHPALVPSGRLVGFPRDDPSRRMRIALTR
jgi:hypothetical protein